MAARERVAIPVSADGATGLTCRAPAVAMHFSVAGDVHACCQNGTYAFGDVRTQSLAEIWDGQRRRSMAAALAEADYPIGCDGCAVEHALGNRAATPAPPFDRFPPDEPEWPRQLEFTLSNRCNLACVQCNGYNSSTIRRRREGREPLPMPYGDRFFEELVPFLDHVEVCAFLGGEPFLTPQARRVWDLLLERGRRPTVQVTTNATVWNANVERYVRSLAMDLAISIDGATAATYEAIRVGADHDRVLQNRDRMLDAARSYGGVVQLNYCLLRANWHEVGRFLQQADELDVHANVIPVWGPAEHSLFTLDHDELTSVVESLWEESQQVAPTLGRNRPVWDATVGLLEDQLARLGSDRSRTVARGRRSEQRQADIDAFTEALRAELRTWADRDCIDVRTADGRIEAVTAPSWAGGLEPQAWVGLALEDLPGVVAAGLGTVEHGEPEARVVRGTSGDLTAILTESRVTTPDRLVRFQAIHISGADRLLVVSPDLPAAAGPA